jgi:hypothetical protein
MKGNTLKLADIQKAAEKAHPHLEIEFEVFDKEGKASDRTVTIYNLLRTREADRPAIAKEFQIIAKEQATATEKKLKASGRRVLSNRIAAALRTLASDDKTFDELVAGLDADSAEYDITMDQLFVAYAEETQLGEALALDKS